MDAGCHIFFRGLLALAFVGFVLHALLQIEAGNDWGYRNYKHQPLTYLGALATLAIAGLVGVVGLYYRVKRFLQERSDRGRQQSHDGRTEL